MKLSLRLYPVVLGACGLLLTCFPSVTPAENVIDLVRDGRPAAAIVLAQNPRKAARFAAYELQHHIRLITGATLPMISEDGQTNGAAVYVGECQFTKALGLTNDGFKSQEYTIRFLPSAIVLAGRDAPKSGTVVYDLDDLPACSGWPSFWEEQGTLHAVHDFLERFCNVRWFNPTELGTSYPTTQSLRVSGTDLRRAPAFRYRDAIGATGDAPERYDAYTALWPESADEFKAWAAEAYPRLHERYPNPGQYRSARGKLARLFLLRMHNGGKVTRCNHSLYGYYDRFWEKNSNRPDLFVDKRSDYFAKGYEGQPPQLCYTSPELIRQVAQDARDYYDEKATGADLGIFWRPSLPNLFPVEPMDNKFFCKCPRCQAFFKHEPSSGQSVYSTGEHSDYFFNFVNEVAKELKKTHPNKYLVTLAYMSHAKMPSFKLASNVAVQFCFAANRSPASRSNYENELCTLKEWASEGAGRPLYLWLYYTFPVESARNGNYHCFPGFFAHTISEQFKLFHDYGILGVFHCGYGQEIESYVTFKMMDDPTLDVDKLLDDYFTRMYGAAAEPMKNIYLGIEKTYCDPALRPEKRVSGPELSWGYLGTEGRMAEYERLLNQARAKAQTDDEKRRISLFDHGVWSYMVAGRKHYMERKVAPIPTVRVPRLPRADGDAAKLDWDKAASLPGPWYDRGGANPSRRAFAGRVAHDDEFLYLELTDPCDTKELVASPAVFPYDDWEVFLARQRALPYRQYAAGPSGLVTALSHGEVNWRMNVSIDEHGVTAVSDTSAPDKWVTRLVLPFRRALPGGVVPGDTIYMNVIRVSGPRISGAYPLAIDTWVSHCTVHEVDRLGKLVLEGK